MGLPGPRRKRQMQRRRGFYCHALEEMGHSNHVRPWGQLGPAASTPGKWMKMFGRDWVEQATKIGAGGEAEIISW